LKRPLDGLRVVVTRSRTQASGLSAKLELLGAEAVELATIEIVGPVDGGDGLTAATGRLETFEWLVLASPNGAEQFVQAADVSRPEIRIACVGPSTAKVMTDAGYHVDLVPSRFVAEALVEAMPPPERAVPRILLVQAEVARPILEDGLHELGYDVERVVAYRTIDATITDVDRDRAASADLVTFASSSTVERFVRLVGVANLPPAIACIGPITAATVLELGMDVDIEAPVSTIDGLIAAIVEWAGRTAG
jgi:uroporphyrinogen-III synthase